MFPEAGMFPQANMLPERDAINFDFRIVGLLTAVITRPDLLDEYITHGAAKDPDGRPMALRDQNLWPRLRRFGFPPDMLAEMLFLFERYDQQAAPMQPMDDQQMGQSSSVQANSAAIHQSLVTIQRLYRTMVAIDFYCPETCPDDQWFRDVVPYLAQTSQPLDAAGVQIES